LSVSPTAAVLRAEARLFGREVGSLVWIVVFPTVLLGIIGAIPDFRAPDPDLGGRRVVDLYVPVAVLLSMIMAAVMTMPLVVVSYRERGILRRVRTTPVAPGALLAAQVVLHAAAVMASVVLVLGVGRIVLDVPLPRSTPGYAVALVVSLAAAFAIGALIAAISPGTRTGSAISMIVLFPSMFTAGVWAPLQVLDGWLRALVERTPLGAASNALDAATLGRFPALDDLGMMVAWTSVCFALASRLFRWE
jgi:ABC-2 type transport system permease protein